MSVSENLYQVFKEELEAQDRQVAGWLLYYTEIKEELEIEKEEIRQGSVGAVSYSHEMKSKTNSVNDTVADTVIRIDSIDERRKAKKVKLIEDIMKSLPLEKKVFLQLRQKYRYHRGGRGRTGAYTKIQFEYAEKMSKLTGISEEEVWKEIRTLQSWWREIIDITVRLALKRNLL